MLFRTKSVSLYLGLNLDTRIKQKETLLTWSFPKIQGLRSRDSGASVPNTVLLVCGAVGTLLVPANVCDEPKSKIKKIAMEINIADVFLLLLAQRSGGMAMLFDVQLLMGTVLPVDSR